MVHHQPCQEVNFASDELTAVGREQVMNGNRGQALRQEKGGRHPEALASKDGVVSGLIGKLWVGEVKPPEKVSSLRPVVLGEASPGSILGARSLRGLYTLQEPPKPMLICSPSTITGTWRLPWVSRNISSMAWASSLTSR